MTDRDRRIEELAAELRALKKAARIERQRKTLADPAVRAKMSAARKAALADPAVRAKMSAASKAALADPAVRAKMSAARKAAWADPAVRAKMSAARKADREERELQPKRIRQLRRGLGDVPQDAFEARLFGQKR